MSSEQTIRFLAHELVALTKLNWNTTQFDGGDPFKHRVYIEPRQPKQNREYANSYQGIRFPCNG